MIGRRITQAVVMVLLCLVVGSEVRAAGADADFEVRPAFEGYFKPGRRLPLDITVRLKGEFPPQAPLVLSVTIDRTMVARRLAPSSGEQRLRLCVLPHVPHTQMTITCAGRLQRFEPRLRPVPAGRYLIGVWGDRAEQRRFLPLARVASPPHVLVGLKADDLPDRPEGWEALDLIVFPDPGETIPAPVRRQLADYVRRGGRVIFLLQQRRALRSHSLLFELLPASLTPRGRGPEAGPARPTPRELDWRTLNRSGNGLRRDAAVSAVLGFSRDLGEVAVWLARDGSGHFTGHRTRPHHATEAERRRTSAALLKMVRLEPAPKPSPDATANACVRPDVYEQFARPEWPGAWRMRSSIAVGFVAVVGLVLLLATRLRGWRLLLAVAGLAGVECVLLSSLILHGSTVRIEQRRLALGRLGASVVRLETRLAVSALHLEEVSLPGSAEGTPSWPGGALRPLASRWESLSVLATRLEGKGAAFAVSGGHLRCFEATEFLPLSFPLRIGGAGTVRVPPELHLEYLTDGDVVWRFSGRVTPPRDAIDVDAARLGASLRRWLRTTAPQGRRYLLGRGLWFADGAEPIIADCVIDLGPNPNPLPRP